MEIARKTEQPQRGQPARKVSVRPCLDHRSWCGEKTGLGIDEQTHVSRVPSPIQPGDGREGLVDFDVSNSHLKFIHPQGFFFCLLIFCHSDAFGSVRGPRRFEIEGACVPVHRGFREWTKMRDRVQPAFFPSRTRGLVESTAGPKLGVSGNTKSIGLPRRRSGVTLRQRA